MTYQTKEQSMGYILKGLLDCGTNSRELKDCIYFLEADIEVSRDISNSETLAYGRRFAEHKKMDAKKEEKLINDIFWAFDYYTVEEAGEFLDAFKKIVYY